MIYDLRETEIIRDFMAVNSFDFPDTCPVCHTGIQARPIFAYLPDTRQMRIVYGCPRHVCGELFIGSYVRVSSSRHGNSYDAKGYAPQSFQIRTFSENIATLSENFIVIYNQASEAEARKLDQISGVGYRKALEFLIKDYVMQHLANGDELDKVRHANLAWIIKQYIDNTRIKHIAERAVWLGNDETHYERLWYDKDISDLKRLIDLVVHFIDMELLADQYVMDMPTGKK